MTRIKKIFKSRTFYIIFSILASLTIWLYVEYIENPDVTNTVKGIKIEFLHEDYVTDRGLIITSKSTDTVSVRLTGKRNVVSQLTNTNLTATVDLADVDKSGQYTKVYTINFPLDTPTPLPAYTNITDLITVNVDKLAEKNIEVRCSLTGSVAEEFVADTPEPDPSVLTVSGPEEVLSKISHALVTIDRQDISKTVDETLPFILMDDSGHEVVSDKLTFSSDTIHVVMRVVMTKEVQLRVNLISGAGADETNAQITYTPSTIKLSGDAEILKNYNYIPLGTIDLSKFPTTTTQTFDITPINGTTNETGVTQAQVAVTIVGLDIRHIDTTNIQPVNVPAGYTATVITTNMDVTLRGKADALEKLTPEDIRIDVDLSEYSAPGAFSVLSKIYINGSTTDIGAVGEYKVTIMLTKDT